MKTFRSLGDYRRASEKDRTVEFIISSERKDRHGTVLSIDGWVLDSYMKNPIVGFMHDLYADSILKSPDPDSVIGTAEVFREGNLLIGRVHFEPEEINPLAGKIYQKVLHGTLRATSVGFLPLEKPAGRWGKGVDADTFFFGRRELLEFSIVNIPSNSDAVRRAFEEQQLKEIMGADPMNKDLALFDIKLALAGVIPKKVKQGEVKRLKSRLDQWEFERRCQDAGVKLK